MLPASRISLLPPELARETVYRLPWRDIAAQYRTNPQYQTYKDPNHVLWRDLYQQRISSYPLPTRDEYGRQPTYRDQFFWASAQIEEWIRQKRVQDLVSHGYDMAFKRLDLTKLPPSLLEQLFLMAAEKGYLTIVKYIWESGDPTDTTIVALEAARLAASRDHPEVVYYLLARSESVQPRQLLDAALRGGRLNLLQTLIERLPTSLNTAELNAALELVIEYNQSDDYQAEAIMDYLISLYPTGTQPDYEGLLIRAINDSRWNMAEYLYQLGARVTPRVLSRVINIFRRSRNAEWWLATHTSPDVYLDEKTWDLWLKFDSLGRSFMDHLPNNLDTETQEAILRYLFANTPSDTVLELEEYLTGHPALNLVEKY